MIARFFSGLFKVPNNKSSTADFEGGDAGRVQITEHILKRRWFVGNSFAFFARVHVAQVLESSSGQDRWIVVLASRRSHSISSMFHLTLLDPQLSPHLSTPFLALATGSSTSPSLFYPSGSPSTATLQGASCFGRVAEQSPLTRTHAQETPVRRDLASTLPSAAAWRRQEVRRHHETSGGP